MLPGLTGLRFFAALWVVAAHFAVFWRPGVVPPALRLLAANGYLGVSVFFVLSGVVLAYTYHGAGTSPRRFLRARAARILPAYYLALAFALPPLLWRGGASEFGPQYGHIGREQVIATLLGAQAWRPGENAYWDSPSWSLSAEALFYALFPLLLPILARIPRRLLPLAALGCWLAAWPLVLGGLDPNYPPERVPEFALGVCIGCWYAQGGRLPFRGSIGLLLVGLIVACALVVPNTNRALVAATLDPLFAAAILLAANVRSTPPFLLLLGEASYATYLLHWPLWEWCCRLAGLPVLGGATPAWLVPCYLAILLGGSLAVFRYWETPLRRLIRGPRPATARAASACCRACDGF